MIECLRIAAFWKKGVPPAVGGYIDQTESIVEACEIIWNEQARWRADKGIHEGIE